MTDYDIHEPEYSETTTEEWNAPQIEDFDTDDLSAIDDRFVLSATGFPPDDFTDLKLPIVDPDGNLNENALQTAHGGAHSVDAIDDIDDGTREDVKDLLEKLSQEEFDSELGDGGQNGPHHKPMGHKFGVGETVSMMVGGVVGGGIYAALGVIVAIAGPAAWLAYVAAGCIALCAGYSYIHLNRNLDSNGASVTFIESYWGNMTVAGMVGWTLLIGYIGTMAMYGYAFGAFSRHMLNVEHMMGISIRPLISAIVILGFMGLNVLGVRETGFVENILVGLKVVIILTFGFWGVWFASQQQSLTIGTSNLGFSPLIGAAVTFVSYEGWQLLFYDQETIENPTETLRKATYIALPIAILIYVLVALATTNLLPQQVVKQQADVALMIAAAKFMPPIGVTLVGLSALFSTASAINATLFSSALYAKNMLTDGLLPDRFGDVDKSGASTRTVLIIGVLTILFTIYGSLEGITSFASLSFIVVFAAMNFLAFRERRSLRFNQYVPLIGLVGSLVFLPLMLYYLYTQEHAVFNAVVLLAIAVIAIELLYFERKSIEEGLYTVKKKL